MGGGNAQKSAISRARNAEKMAKVKKGGSALLSTRDCFGLTRNSARLRLSFTTNENIQERHQLQEFNVDVICLQRVS